MAVTRTRSALAASAALLALAACAHRDGEPFETVSLEEVERMVGEPDVVVIDANTADLFRRSHLPGARRWKSAPPEQLLPPERDRRLVFYCVSPT
jgi:rhodanese-related sulfurtransferase